MRKISQNKPHQNEILGESFRDPAGYMFRNPSGKLLRFVSKLGADDYDLLIKSGLYDTLATKGLLIQHEELKPKNGAHAILEPKLVPFISYPFEWSFSQLKDAALITLKAQKIALKRGMSLKDASSYNVQFLNGKPVLIDTLSFEVYEPGTPWQAYRQFCQHFLAPLALMSYTDTSLSQLMRIYIDGIPLDLAAKLLPTKARLRPGLAMHIFLHAKAQSAKASTHKKPKQQVKLNSLIAILDSLERTISRLQPQKSITEWGDYYNNTNYSNMAADQKARLVRSYAKDLKATTAIDLGGNNGTYSRILADLNINTICSDIDPNAVEMNYRMVKLSAEPNLLPLLVDFTNPGGSLGWHNSERAPIHTRVKTDIAMALAIIHHLAISNNLPFLKIAEYFKEFAPNLILEFVPKSDSQVKKLLATRDDIFPDYNEDGLKLAFSKHYRLIKETRIKSSKRTLYLFKRI